jgi:hypothetical protein
VRRPRCRSHQSPSSQSTELDQLIESLKKRSEEHDNLLKKIAEGERLCWTPSLGLKPWGIANQPKPKGERGEDDPKSPTAEDGKKIVESIRQGFDTQVRDFKQALSAEVRTMLTEVGALRDQKKVRLQEPQVVKLANVMTAQTLQTEIAEVRENASRSAVPSSSSAALCLQGQAWRRSSRCIYPSRVLCASGLTMYSSGCPRTNRRSQIRCTRAHSRRAWGSRADVTEADRTQFQADRKRKSRGSSQLWPLWHWWRRTSWPALRDLYTGGRSCGSVRSHLYTSVQAFLVQNGRAFSLYTEAMQGVLQLRLAG